MTQTLEATYQPGGPLRRSSDWLARRIAWATLRFPRWSRLNRWNPLISKACELEGTSFRVHTDDGVELDAVLVHANPDVPPGLPIVMAHGIVEIKECHARRANFLASHGHDVILFDTRAHGHSTGSHVTFGVRERHDIRAVVDHARQQGWIGQRIIAMGGSLGAGTVLQYAAIDPRVAGVIALAPFADMASAVASYRRLLAPWVPQAWLMRGFEGACREAGFCMSEASAVDAMAKLQVSVLLIVGERDRNLPAEQHTERLAAACHAQGDCQLLTIPDATHITLFRRSQPEMDEAIIEFCRRLTHHV